QLLTEDQEFYVMFFSNRTFPMFDPSPVWQPIKATKVNKVHVRRWVSDFVVHGGTVPDESIRMALSMRPDAVFLLSDGDFAPSARQAALDANQNGAVIHTVAIGFRAGITQLKQIAEDHKGRFRYVP